MSLTYGYELDSAPGRVFPPPLLHDKITLTSSGNTTRWVFYGTRKQILAWMREHPNLVVENAFFTGQNYKNLASHTEILFDMQYIADSEQSYVNYVRSFFVSDYEQERVKVEIRPRIESKDTMILTLCRIITRSGVRLGDVVDQLEHEWYKPARSYYQQAVDLFQDNPGPCHVLSSDGPSSIRVVDATPTTNPTTEAPTQTGPPAPAAEQPQQHQQPTPAH